MPERILWIVIAVLLIVLLALAIKQMDGTTAGIHPIAIELSCVVRSHLLH